jgi:hypothetical protein
MMAIPNRAGTFNALPIKMGVDNTGPNDLATVTIQFGLYEELVGGEWVDVAQDVMTITGYFYLENKDGAINTITVENLKAALGWDGADLEWFAQADLTEHPVQVVLAFEQYQGKDKLKVKYLNPHGYVSKDGVSQGDEATVSAISARLGSKLRALGGGTQKKSPPPRAAAPKSPPKKSPPAKAPTAAPTAGCTADEAWAAFVAAGEALGLPDEVLQTQWFAALTAMFPSKQPENLTPVEWGKVKSEASQRVVLPL